MKPITIVIPTFNRARSLEMVLPSYKADIDVLEEILVVDDGSSDGTADVVRSQLAHSPIPIRLIRHDYRQGAQACRMHGVSEAKTSYILFGEDDVWFSPGYCRSLLNEGRNLNADIIGGRMVVVRYHKELNVSELHDPGGRRDVRIDFRNFSIDFAAKPPGAVCVPHMHSCTLISTRLFSKLKFDSSFKGNGFREETDFYLAARARGASVWFTPNATSYHLKGMLNASGGQRRAPHFCRLWVEVWCAVNTYKLVRKHKCYLRQHDGFPRNAEFYMIFHYFPFRLRPLFAKRTGE